MAQVGQVSNLILRADRLENLSYTTYTFQNRAAVIPTSATRLNIATASCQQLDQERPFESRRVIEPINLREDTLSRIMAAE